MNIKQIKSLALAGIAMLALSLSFSAQAQKQFFSGTGTAVGTTLSYAVVSAFSGNGGTPVVTYLAADSEKAGSKVLFYTVTAPTTANFVSTTTSVPVTATNGFVSGDIIVIRHTSTDTYERRVLTTFTSGTNLTVTVAPTVALAVGDLVYDAQAAGNIPWGAVNVAGVCGGTNAIVGGTRGIYYGQANMPLLLEIDFTAVGHISAVSATYQIAEAPRFTN